MKSKTKPSKIAGKQCLVCGDKASAYNFAGLSCESCKIFFRRNAYKTDLFCESDQNPNGCSITKTNRRHCAACRLHCCFKIGMRRELVKTRKSEEISEEEDMVELILSLEEQITREEAIFYTADRLNSHELEQINELDRAMNTCFANEKSMPVAVELTHFMDAFSLYGRYTRKIIKFCKTITAFRDLHSNDQLALLKPFHSEIISIRTSFLYDPVSDGFLILLNDWEQQVAFVPLHCYRACTVLDLETYCRHFLTQLQVLMEGDPILCELIIALKLFQMRHNLGNPDFIRTQNLVYCRLIRRYLGQKYPQAIAEEKFTHMMHLLAELHILRDKNRRVYAEIERQAPQKVDDALLEFYELQ